MGPPNYATEACEISRIGYHEFPNLRSGLRDTRANIRAGDLVARCIVYLHSILCGLTINHYISDMTSSIHYYHKNNTTVAIANYVPIYLTIPG